MTWDPVWEEVFQSQAWGKYPSEDLIRFVARNFYDAADRSQINLLEAGCGPGANLWFLTREGFQAHGVDGSQTAINLAHSRLDRECPGWQGKLHRGDIRRLPYPDMTFDGAIDVECIYSNPFDASREIYQELARVTKAGGKLFSRTFARDSWGDGTGVSAGHHAWFCSHGPLAGKGFSRFTSLDEISDLVSGWQVRSIEMITHTRENRLHTVREFVIEAEKA